jgi:hypothetical protein
MASKIVRFVLNQSGNTATKVAAPGECLVFPVFDESKGEMNRRCALDCRTE